MGRISPRASWADQKISSSPESMGLRIKIEAWQIARGTGARGQEDFDYRNANRDPRVARHFIFRNGRNPSERRYEAFRIGRWQSRCEFSRGQRTPLHAPATQTIFDRPTHTGLVRSLKAAKQPGESRDAPCANKVSRGCLSSKFPDQAPAICLANSLRYLRSISITASR